jgi:hypothetical protein
VSVVAFATTIGLGIWGWSRVSAHKPKSGTAEQLAQHFLGRIYLTLQLFVLHPQELPRHYPWQVEAARFLAPVLLVIATVYLLTVAFEAHMRHAWLKRSPRHAIVCGAGVHGTRLTENLLRAGIPVVLVDIDARAPGMQSRLRRRETRLVADTVNEDTLRRAGVSRAVQLIAVTGDDVVNAQIASTVRDLWEKERWRREPLVLVQAEDRVLARFLEDCDGKQPDRRPDSESSRAERPEVRTFGANTLAAVALFGGGPLAGTRPGQNSAAPLADAMATDDCHILLAGDHGLLEAIVVTALRRGRAQRLRRGTPPGGPSPLRITLVGASAERYAHAITERWQLDPGIVDLSASEVDPRTEPAVLSSRAWSEWQRDVTHAVVACEDEHASITIAVTLSRILGPTVKLTRVSTQPGNELDKQLESYAGEPPRFAPISVLSITDLAWGARAERVQDVPPAGRLVAALSEDGVDRPEAEEMTKQLLNQSDLGLHSDAAPAISPATASVLDGLLRSVRDHRRAVTVSALVAAGLSPDLAAPCNLRRAAEQLTRDLSPDAFIAWCEYVRLIPDAEAEAPGLLAAAATADRHAAPLKLRAATLGSHEALDGLIADQAIVDHLNRRVSPRIAIFAGGASSMSAETQHAIARLLTQALYRYDGLILTGGNDVGLCGAVREAAGANRVPVLGYAPAARGAAGAWLRSTPAGDFSGAEPVAIWTDLLAAAQTRKPAASAADVRIVAFPGGSITATEIILGRALGAAVASVDPCEELVEPLDEILPFGSGGVLSLPSDPMTLRAFLMWPNQQLDNARRLIAARELHDQYRQEQRNHKHSDDLALAAWERLSPMLRRSNLAAVDDIPNKLAVLGMRLRVGGERLRLRCDQAELLAEMEHGRYNFERLSAGWELGRTRQLSRLVSPYLTPWSDLEDKVKQWDRDAVLALDKAIQKAGWGVAPDELAARDRSAR